MCLRFPVPEQACVNIRSGGAGELGGEGRGARMLVAALCEWL
jgi:hypothetical protein